MDYSYELRISAMDAIKILRFCGTDAEELWDELYQSASAITDDAAEQSYEDGIDIAWIDVDEVSLAELIEGIIEEAGSLDKAIKKALRNDDEIVYIE